MILIGPTGSIVKGDVLDCAWEPLQRTLRFYDPQLYLQWNPNKRKGLGVWEVRRRPNKKSVYEVYEWEGNTYLHIDWLEIDIVNHVLDCNQGLNYSVVEKIKKMDTWQDKNWVKNLESAEKEYTDNLNSNARKELVYGLKQYRRAARDLRESVLSGTPLTELARAWGRK